MPAHVNAGEPALEPETHPVAGLEVVAEFGDMIYPGWPRSGKPPALAGKAGPDGPVHIVLNAENHHT